jgi:septal ring factor EnvC (AmiA/AmiB activator)
LSRSIFLNISRSRINMNTKAITVMVCVTVLSHAANAQQPDQCRPQVIAAQDYREQLQAASDRAAQVRVALDQAQQQLQAVQKELADLKAKHPEPKAKDKPAPAPDGPKP